MCSTLMGRIAEPHQQNKLYRLKLIFCGRMVKKYSQRKHFEIITRDKIGLICFPTLKLNNN